MPTINVRQDESFESLLSSLGARGLTILYSVPFDDVVDLKN